MANGLALHPQIYGNARMIPQEAPSQAECLREHHSRRTSAVCWPRSGAGRVGSASVGTSAGNVRGSSPVEVAEQRVARSSAGSSTISPQQSGFRSAESHSSRVRVAKSASTSSDSDRSIASVCPVRPPDGIAEPLPELRFQRPQRVPAAALARVHPVAGPRAIEHVLRRMGSLAEVWQQQPRRSLRHRHVDHSAAARPRALDQRCEHADHRALRAAEKIAELHRRHAAVARDHARQGDVADVVPRPIAPRSALPEAGDAADHQPARIPPADPRTRAAPARRAGRFQTTSAAAQRRRSSATPSATLQIEDHRSLPAVQRREHPRRDLAQVVARSRGPPP